MEGRFGNFPRRYDPDRVRGYLLSPIPWGTPVSITKLKHFHPALVKHLLQRASFFPKKCAHRASIGDTFEEIPGKSEETSDPLSISVER
jgi:hypothetical protein